MIGWRRVGLGCALGVMLGAGDGGAQGPPSDHADPPGTPSHEHAPRPARLTMDELHQQGGVPLGWRFAMPPGDPQAGRAVFAKLECYTCHEVAGEVWPNSAAAPQASGDARRVGPPLAGMGAHHSAEYLAESILNPNAVIVTGPGYTGPDGLSIMPDYRDSLTVAEMIDLVAYLRGLVIPEDAGSGSTGTTGPPGQPPGDGGGPKP